MLKVRNLSLSIPVLSTISTTPSCSKEQHINLKDLKRLEQNGVVDTVALIKEKKIDTAKDGVKVLGIGEIDKAFTVKARKFSKSAKEKIEAVGGKVEVV